MLKWLRSIIPRRAKGQTIGEWFHVSWDADVVYLDVSPPGREAWRASFEWSSIRRVCFKAEDLLVSDGIYVFTAQRPESYVIPTEADLGVLFWEEILRRRLFDADVAPQAASATEGLYCWPPGTESEQESANGRDTRSSD